MATKKRNYKKEYQQQKKRIAKNGSVHEARMERQRARRKLDITKPKQK